MEKGNQKITISVNIWLKIKFILDFVRYQNIQKIIITKFKEKSILENNKASTPILIGSKKNKDIK